MDNYHHSVYKMWDEFISEFPQFKNENFTAWYFCNTENCANKLAELSVSGVKRGTTSLLYWYENGKESMPYEGELSIVTDWDGIAKCIIQNRNITILPFKDFTKELAFIEGEGDKSLEYWREAHINFFENEMKEESLSFSEEMNVVFTEFRKLYPD